MKDNSIKMQSYDKYEDRKPSIEDSMSIKMEISKKMASMQRDYLNLKTRHSLLLVAIVTLVFASVLLSQLFIKSASTQGTVLAVFVCGILLCISCLATIVIISMAALFRTFTKYVAPIFWVLMISTTLLASTISPMKLTPLVYIEIVLLYVAIPTDCWIACSAGISSAALQIIMMYYNSTNLSSMYNYLPLISEICVLLSANIFGIYLKYTADSFDKSTFTQAYNDIKSIIELEEERQRQEQLLLSVIPAELAHQMRHSMQERLTEVSGQPTGLSSRRLWHDFYVKEHKQVSILYADLVGFTHLTTKCSAKDLVTMLNEIYGRFDSISRANDCMRIKTLGDCYCCVSGMPVSRPLHAQNVVKAGLQMVHAIKSVREMTTCSINMRIGVHSGNVLCGVLGTIKWKYDIWSEDVSYANFLESTGVPGRIHVSRATMLQLGDLFTMDLVNPPVQNSQGEPQETFLIKEYLSNNTTYNNHERRRSFQRSRSISSNSSTQQLYTFLQSWGAPKPFGNLKSPKRTDNQVPKRSIEMLEASFDSTFLSQGFCVPCDPRLNSQFDKLSLHPTNQRDSRIVQKTYKDLQQNSSLMLSFICLLYFVTAAVPNCANIEGHVSLFITSGMGLLILLYIIYFASIRWLKQGNRKKLLKRSFLLAYYSLLVLLVALLLLLTLIIDLTPYHALGVDSIKMLPNVSSTSYEQLDKLSLDAIQFRRLIEIMMVLSVFLFVYTSYLIKLAVTICTLVTVLCMLFLKEKTVYDQLQIPTYRVVDWFSLHGTLMVFICVFMIVIARQMEYGDKSLIMWKLQYCVENDEVETVKNLTKLLLTNILPQHVASYYLNGHDADADLYHESYENVCIMFASVVNFGEFFKMSSDHNRQEECLRLLNEIIGDIDMLLCKPKYSMVEKMKTIGSTYMAAAGLQPGRDVKQGDKGILCLSTRRTTEQFVQLMAEFALAIFHIIDTINKHSFNSFRLRIGISHGPVIAGVVGAQKPQYDVWGDTVNMASRMESGGIVDCIQMTENTGDVLMSLGYPVVCRGKTSVKGKSELLTTYLLQPDGQALSSIPVKDRSSLAKYLNHS